ncbi:MAG: response regulator [Prolixibacteraceae bacterium]|nr:response regulator [Prolixibacteraceae bacterium]
MIDPTLKNANILIVDDQEANLDVLEGFLDMQGYNSIKTTQDPREVIQLFGSFEPDLILLDLSMPYLTGFEVMEQIKSILSPNTYLPILVLTADVTTESKQRALSGGASDFLTKPFDLVEVGLRIRNLLFTSFLQQQLHSQNQMLEEKVKERTKELESKNAELIVAKEKAEASDRLKSSFINNISHEIRTPLNGILGFGQILTDPDLPENEKEEYLEMMSNSSARLINTISNFMDISLISSGNQTVFKKDLKVNQTIKEISNRFKEACDSKNLAYQIQIPDISVEPTIYTDNEMFGKILSHLIDNAIKFTKHGQISVGYTFENNKLQFFVKDTGIGIEKNNLDLVFNNFWQENSTTTRGYEGSGLGLPISKGFIDLLGGEIWFISEKEIGSTFFFSLPITNGYTESKKARNANQEFGRQTILIAEDDDINFFYINTVLKHSLIEIIRAENGREAVEHCKTNPEIEIVLMDLKMPDMDGFEATRQIKTERPDLPVIAITAYSGTEDKEKAIESGCDDFITKPLKREYLIKKMESYGLLVSY